MSNNSSFDSEKSDEDSIEEDDTKSITEKEKKEETKEENKEEQKEENKEEEIIGSKLNSSWESYDSKDPERNSFSKNTIK